MLKLHTRTYNACNYVRYTAQESYSCAHHWRNVAMFECVSACLCLHTYQYFDSIYFWHSAYHQKRSPSPGTRTRMIFQTGIQVEDWTGPRAKASKIWSAWPSHFGTTALGCQMIPDLWWWIDGHFLAVIITSCWVNQVKGQHFRCIDNEWLKHCQKFSLESCPRSLCIAHLDSCSPSLVM